MIGEDSRRFRRGAAMLTLGIGSSGVLTYAYFALASHALEPDRYGALVVLWSALFISVFTLYRPVEQYISRTVSAHDVRGEDSGEALRVAATIQLGLAITYVVVALLLRGPIEDDLLNGEGELYTVLLISAPAYAVSFFARGYLAGHRRFGLYGAMLLLESTSRFCFALVVAIGLATGVGVVSLGVVVAPLMSLLVVPVVAVRGGGRPLGGPGARTGPSAPASAALAGGGRFVGAAFLIMLSEQALLNAGVLVVGAAAGAVAAGFLFNVLLIARAPQVLFGAVTTSLLPTLSRLHARDEEGTGASFRGQVRSTLVAVSAFAFLAALVLLLAGPQLMRLTFGGDLDYDRAGLLIVAAGMGLHLASLTLTQAALARDLANAAAVRWVACAGGFVVFTLLPLLGDVRRVEVGYATAALVLCALLATLYTKGPPPGSGTTPS